MMHLGAGASRRRVVWERAAAVAAGVAVMAAAEVVFASKTGVGVGLEVAASSG